MLAMETSIQLSTLTSSYTIPIDNTSTIGRIKEYMFEDEGIETDMQHISPVVKNWLWQDRVHSDELSDGTLVRTAMKAYNTKKFYLFLSRTNYIMPDNCS
jgi:hypothetical protein